MARQMSITMQGGGVGIQPPYGQRARLHVVVAKGYRWGFSSPVCRGGEREVRSWSEVMQGANPSGFIKSIVIHPV